MKQLLVPDNLSFSFNIYSFPIKIRFQVKQALYTLLLSRLWHSNKLNEMLCYQTIVSSVVSAAKSGNAKCSLVLDVGLYVLDLSRVLRYSRIEIDSSESVDFASPSPASLESLVEKNMHAVGRSVWQHNRTRQCFISNAIFYRNLAVGKIQLEHELGKLKREVKQTKYQFDLVALGVFIVCQYCCIRKRHMNI